MSTSHDFRVALSPARLTHLANVAAANREDWRHLLRFDPQQRWYHRLHVDHDHEVWLLSWLPGQRTGLHDHGGSSGAFAVVQGKLQEQTLAPSHREFVARTIAPGRVRAFGPQHMHEVGNISADPAVSVHVYSPRLTVMNRYELSATGLTHLGVEREIQDW